MTELQTLFEKARTTQPTPPETLDADVVRGRRALSRRRLRRMPIAIGMVAVAAVGAFAAASRIATSSGPATAASSQTGDNAASSPGAQASIQLVAYTGAQPQGYTVDSVPAGWQIQGVSNYVLAIAPIGDHDTSIDSFAGKLVVMLRSTDDVATRTGDNVMIGSQPAVIDHSEDAFTTQVFFTDTAGHRIDIQVPSALHWSDAQITAFAAAVHVNASAQAGVG